MAKGTPPLESPYRSSAREAPRPRRRARLGAPVISILGVPRYAAFAVVAVAALTCGGLNLETRGRDEILTPKVEAAEDAIALALLVTIPLVALLLRRAWRKLPASPALKWRHLLRSTMIQAGAVGVAALAIVVVRPSSAPVLAGGSGPHGEEAYVFRRDWACGYRIGVSDGDFAIRGVAAVGPFSCDAPAPRVEWHDQDIALVAADGTAIGEGSASSKTDTKPPDAPARALGSAAPHGP